MDAKRRKELLAQFKKKETEKLLSGLEVDVERIKELMNHLDDHLSQNGCDHTLNKSQAFLEANNLPIESTLNWFRENGGYCDCEVLANIEDKIEAV